MTMLNKISLIIVLFTCSFFLTFCAGSKDKTDSSYETSASEQDDLDDIEKLLGITTEETTAQTEQPAPKSQNETLQLLDTNEMAANKPASGRGALSQKERDRYEQKIADLEKTLRAKDRKIESLQQQLKEKELAVSSKPQKATYSQGIASVPEAEFPSRYDEARAAFEARDYQTAIQLFESLLATSSTHSLSDNAQYWIGESHYALRQYDAAIIDFEKVMTFPSSNKKADAQFKLGLCYLKKGQKDKAIEELNRLRENYPDSPNVERAVNLLSNL